MGLSQQTDIVSQSLVDERGIEQLNDTIQKIEELSEQLANKCDELEQANPMDNRVTEMRRILESFEQTKQSIETYQSINSNDTFDLNTYAELSRNLNDAVVSAVTYASHNIKEEQDSITQSINDLMTGVIDTFNSQGLQKLQNVGELINSRAMTLADSPHFLRDVVLRASNEIRQNATDFLSEGFLSQELVNKINEKTETSTLQSMSSSLFNLSKSIKEVSAFAVDTMDSHVNSDAAMLKDKTDDIYTELKNARSGKNKGEDTVTYMQKLNELATTGREALEVLNTQADYIPSEKFGTLLHIASKLDSQVTLAESFRTAMQTQLGLQTNEGTGIKDIISKIHEKYRSAMARERTRFQEEVKNVKDDERVTKRIISNHLSNIQSYANPHALANTFEIASHGKHTLLDSSDLRNAIANYNRVGVYGAHIFQQHKDSTSIKYKHISHDDIMIADRHKQMSALQQENKALLQIGNGIPISAIAVSDAQKRKDDATLIEQVREQIEAAINNTRRAIEAERMIDPKSKTADVLEEQVKQLEKQKEDIEEGRKNKGIGKLKDIFSDVTSVWGVVKKGLTAFGLGSLFSITDFASKIKERYEDNGRLMYQNYMANISIGASGNTDSWYRVMGMGQKYYALSNGEIAFGAPTEMYRGFVKNVGGAYGGTPMQNAKDMQRFTEAFFAMSKVYDIDQGTFNKALTAFYKNDRNDAETAIQRVYDAVEKAQALNIPVNKYIDTVSGLSDVFRNLGFQTRQAIGIFDHLVAQHMRVEDAQGLVANMASSHASFSLNKTNAVYGMMVGQSTNIWQAITDGMISHDMNGNPIGNRYKLIGERMRKKYEIFGSMGVTQAEKAVLINQQMQNDNINPKNASIMTNLILEGKDEELGKILEGTENEEAKKNKDVQTKIEEFDKQLDVAGNQLSETQKTKALKMLSANKVADYLHTTAHEMMQTTFDALRQLVSEFGKKFADLIEWASEFLKKPMVKQGLYWMSQNPELALAGLLAGYVGLRVAAKGMWGVTKYGAKQLWNRYISNQRVRGPRRSSLSNSNGLWNQAKQLGKRAKNFFRIGGGSSGGSSGGGGKGAKILKFVATAGTFLGITGLSNTAEASEEDENKDDEDKLADLFSTGRARWKLYTISGKPLDVQEDQKIYNFVQSKDWGDKLFYGGIAVATTAYSLYRNRNASLPSSGASGGTGGSTGTGSGNGTGGSSGEAGGRGAGGSGGMSGAMTNIRSTITNALPRTRGDMLKGLKNIASEMKGNIALTALFSTAAEFSDPEERDMGTHIARIGVDTGVYATSSYATTKAVQGAAKLVGFIPYVGKPLSVAMNFAAPIAGMYASSQLGGVSEDIKTFLGFGKAVDKETLKFIETLTDETDMYGHNVVDIIESKTQQGENLKEWLKENGVDYEKLSTKEKEIFKSMMDSFKNAHMALAYVMALGANAFSQYKNYSDKLRAHQRLNADGTVLQLTKAKNDEIQKEADVAYSVAEQMKKIKEENPDLSDLDAEYEANKQVLMFAAQEAEYKMQRNKQALEELNKKKELSDEDKELKKQLDKEQAELQKIIELHNNVNLNTLTDEDILKEDETRHGIQTDTTDISSYSDADDQYVTLTDAVKAGGRDKYLAQWRKERYDTLWDWTSELKKWRVFRHQQEALDKKEGVETLNSNVSIPHDTGNPNGTNALSAARIKPYLNSILKYAQQYGVDANYMAAILLAETGARQYGDDGKILTSSAGALGIAQFMPETAAELGVNPYDVDSSIEGLAKYTARNRDLLGTTDVAYLAAAYNAGAGAVQSGEAFTYKETQGYIENVTAYMNGLGLPGGAGDAVDYQGSWQASANGLPAFNHNISANDIQNVLNRIHKQTMLDKAKAQQASHMSMMKEMGFSDKATKGRIVNGLYIDPTQKFESIQDRIARANGMLLPEAKTMPQVQNQPKEPAQQEKLKQAATQAAKQKIEEQKRSLKTMQEQSKQNIQMALELQKNTQEEKKQSGEDAATLSVVGVLLSDKKADDMLAEINKRISEFCDFTISRKEGA